MLQAALRGIFPHPLRCNSDGVVSDYSDDIATLRGGKITATPLGIRLISRGAVSLQARCTRRVQPSPSFVLHAKFARIAAEDTLGAGSRPFGYGPENFVAAWVIHRVPLRLLSSSAILNSK